MLEINESEARNITNLNIDWSKMPKSGTNYTCLNIQDNLNIIGHYIERQTNPNPMLGKKSHEAIVSKTIQNLKQQHAYAKSKTSQKAHLMNRTKPLNRQRPIRVTSFRWRN